MSLIYFPSLDEWKLDILAPTASSHSTLVPGDIITNDSTYIAFDLSDVTKDSKFEVYHSTSEGISIADERMIVVDARFSIVPESFSECAFFIEDGQGNRMTYGVSKKDIGKITRYNVEACANNAEFNPAYVVKIGYLFSEPKVSAPVAFAFRLTSLALSSVPVPLYADPQETVRFLGLATNDGKPLILSYDSNPSYEYICELITQAESFIDENTHMSWKERREVDEIQNAPLASSLSGLGYAGIWAGFAETYSDSSLLKGYPVTLNRQYIRPIDYSKGDKVEVRTFGTYWNTVPEEQIWEDETKGIIFIKRWIFQREDSVRVTYRWGKTGGVPEDIKMCAKLIACQHIVSTDWYRAKFPQSPEFDPIRGEVVMRWTWDIKNILKNYQHDSAIGFL